MIALPTTIASPPGRLYNSRYTFMNRLALIRRVPLFAVLNESELAALAEDFTPAHFDAGDVIFQQGDAGHALYLIETGKVRIFVQNEEGQELSVNVCGAGEVFGEMSVIDELPRSASAAAMEPTVLLRLTRERFREHLRRTPQLALAFMKALTGLLRRSTRELDSVTLATVPTRLARKLIELADRHGQPEPGGAPSRAGRSASKSQSIKADDALLQPGLSPGGVRVTLALTQSDLASMLGATRESVNKALSRFRQRGLIRWEQGQVVIVDVAGLRLEAE